MHLIPSAQNRVQHIGHLHKYSREQESEDEHSDQDSGHSRLVANAPHPAPPLSALSILFGPQFCLLKMETIWPTSRGFEEDIPHSCLFQWVWSTKNSRGTSLNSRYGRMCGREKWASKISLKENSAGKQEDVQAQEIHIFSFYFTFTEM